jgi:flagellar hook-length control protein FliK
MPAATDPADASAWLNVRPDSLAMALADQALAQDPATQMPIKLDQMLQSLDAQLSGMASSANLGIAGGEANAEEPLGAVAALADAQNNQAVQVQAAGMPADTPEPVSLSLNAPMQQASRWATEFGDRLAWVANNRFTAATLQINPPQLGPIEVRILMSGDQAAVSFAAVQPQTREAIQQALPVLASSFASQGLSLGQTSVGREHLPQQGGQGGSGNSNASGQSGLMAASISNAGGVAADAMTRGGNGLVDTFV